MIEISGNTRYKAACRWCPLSSKPLSAGTHKPMVRDLHKHVRGKHHNLADVVFGPKESVEPPAKVRKVSLDLNVVRYILSNHLAFSTVEKPTFRAMFEASEGVKCSVGMMGRDKFATLLAAVFDHVRKKVAEEIFAVLHSGAKINTGIDGWTSNHTYMGYGSISASYITENFEHKVRKLLIQSRVGVMDSMVRCFVR